MNCRLVYLILGLPCLCLAQNSTYFNVITGADNLLRSQTSAGIHAAADGYVVWGGGVDDGTSFYFLRKYNVESSDYEEFEFILPGESLFIGIRTSFQFNPYTNQYVVFQGGGENGGGLQGRMLVFNDNLELEQNLYFDLFPPHTYFYGFLVEPDGYIVSGEMFSATGVFPTYNGTFLTKIDFEGNVVWNQVLKPRVPGYQYRNNYLLKTETGYILTGWGRFNSNVNSWGQITFTDQDGIVVHDLEMQDPSLLQSGGVVATRGTDNALRMIQGLAYADHPSENPTVLYTKMRVFELNETSLDTIHLNDLFTDYDRTSWDGFSELITTEDNGLIILGSLWNPGFTYRNGFIIKLTEDATIDWFKEYTWIDCNNCEHVPYDIEPTPDGGYVVAGYFVNYAENPRQRVWIFKVDACGDLEWQGCSPLNVPERKGQSFAVYPNPSTGRFTVETANQSRVLSYRVYDLSGRLLAQERLSAAAGSFTIDVNVPSGFYTLQVTTDGGQMEAYKIQVVR